MMLLACRKSSNLKRAVHCDLIPVQEVDENAHEIKRFMIKTVSLKRRLFFSESSRVSLTLIR